VPTKGVLTVAYKQDVQLDEGYYLTRHAETIERVWGPLGLERTEVHKLATAADIPASPYQIIWSGYFASVQAVQDVLQYPASGEVMGEIPNYYQGAPDVSVGEVIICIGVRQSNTIDPDVTDAPPPTVSPAATILDRKMSRCRCSRDRGCHAGIWVAHSRAAAETYEWGHEEACTRCSRNCCDSDPDSARHGAFSDAPGIRSDRRGHSCGNQGDELLRDPNPESGKPCQLEKVGSIQVRAVGNRPRGCRPLLVHRLRLQAGIRRRSAPARMTASLVAAQLKDSSLYILAHATNNQQLAEQYSALGLPTTYQPATMSSYEAGEPALAHWEIVGDGLDHTVDAKTTEPPESPITASTASFCYEIDSGQQLLLTYNNSTRPRVDAVITADFTHATSLTDLFANPGLRSIPGVRFSNAFQFGTWTSTLQEGNRSEAPGGCLEPTTA
jgi:hypothetical protein